MINTKSLCACPLTLIVISIMSLSGCQTSEESQKFKAGLENIDYEAAKESSPKPDRELSYIGISGEEKEIFVFLPNSSKNVTNRRAIVLFHGGGWRAGSPEQFFRQAKIYSDLGLVVLLPVYSLEGKDGTTPRESLEDAFLAWNTIIKLGPKLGYDPHSVMAGGGSAGGHLALGLATLKSSVGTSIQQPPTALVLFNPVVDTSREGYGYDRVKSYWKSFSPFHNVGHSKHPDTLILVGDQDKILPVDKATKYCERVRATGASCKLEVYKGETHSWFNNKGFSDTLRDSTKFIEQLLSSNERKGYGGN